MAVVTALRAAGRGRVRVELDGQAWRVLPLEPVVRAGLAEGVELDRARLRTLARELRRACARPARPLRAVPARAASPGWGGTRRDGPGRRNAAPCRARGRRALRLCPRAGARGPRTRRRGDPFRSRAARDLAGRARGGA